MKKPFSKRISPLAEEETIAVSQEEEKILKEIEEFRLIMEKEYKTSVSKAEEIRFNTIEKARLREQELSLELNKEMLAHKNLKMLKKQYIINILPSLKQKVAPIFMKYENQICGGVDIHDRADDTC